jgi:hypothetical protein
MPLTLLQAQTVPIMPLTLLQAQTVPLIPLTLLQTQTVPLMPLTLLQAQTVPLMPLTLLQAQTVPLMPLTHCIYQISVSIIVQKVKNPYNLLRNRDLQCVLATRLQGTPCMYFSTGCFDLETDHLHQYRNEFPALSKDSNGAFVKRSEAQWHWNVSGIWRRQCSRDRRDVYTDSVQHNTALYSTTIQLCIQHNNTALYTVQQYSTVYCTTD